MNNKKFENTTWERLNKEERDLLLQKSKKTYIEFYTTNPMLDLDSILLQDQVKTGYESFQKTWMPLMPKLDQKVAQWNKEYDRVKGQ